MCCTDSDSFTLECINEQYPDIYGSVLKQSTFFSTAIFWCFSRLLHFSFVLTLYRVAAAARRPLLQPKSIFTLPLASRRIFSRERIMARGLHLSALVIVLVIIGQGDSQCLQNFDFPGGGFDQTHAIIYDIFTCLRCADNTFTILVAGSGGSPASLTNSTSGVTILPPSGSEPEYTLMIPVPRDVLSNTVDTIIGCTTNTSTGLNQEDIRFSELVFGAPVLNPSGAVDIEEGTSGSLACSRSAGTVTGIAARWTFGSTTLATSTDNVNYMYTNIMRSQSGDYNCTLEHPIGSGSAPRYLVAMSAVVTINVQYPPVVTLDTSQITREMGETITLQCMFEGNPTPTITWWFNNNDMLDTTLPRFTANINVSESTATLIIMSLVGDDTGTYQCRGMNSIGPSNSSMVSITVQVPPDPVSNLQTGTVTSSSIYVSWVLGFDGRESIDNVTVTYTAVSNNDGNSAGSVPLGASATSTNLTGLQPFTNYSISVVTTNNVGDSTPENITVQTMPVVPGSPTNVMVSPISSTQLRVSWMTPTRNTSTQTEFEMSRIEYSLSSDFSGALMISVSASMTAIDTPSDLMKGTVYYFRVSIRNSAGFGPVSDTASERTAVDPPTAVEGLSLISYPNSICVSWSMPNDNGGQPINRYSVQWASVMSGDDGSTPSNTTTDPVIGESSTAVVNPPSTTHLLMDLGDTTTYIVNVSAGNMEAGLGMVVQRNITTGSAIPLHPSTSITSSDVTAISVRLAWNDVMRTSYIVEYRLSSQPNWNNPSRQPPSASNMAWIVGLESDMTYLFRVLVLNNCTQQVIPEVTVTTLPLVVNVTGAMDGGRTVTVGANNVTLRCVLSTGQDAPEVMWRREEGPLPTDAQGVNESTLVIFDPQPEDSGNYTCVSRGLATSTLALMIVEDIQESQGLELWIIIVIAVAAALSMLLFLVVLIVIICVCCRRNTSKVPAYHMQLQKKTSSAGGWIDEGAGGFVPSTMQSGSYKPTIDDEVDAPIVRGRTHTQDAYTAATFTRKNELSNNTDV